MSESTTPAIKAVRLSPYQLDQGQVVKASRALLKHIKDASTSSTSPRPNLLVDSDDPTSTSPVYLTLTTKMHITDTKRLKPALIAVPHALHASLTTSICLITADPQRTYKDIIASPAFPADLAKRITRVIGVTKLKQKYSQYEAQRQLYAEHDIFLADDRIITLLSKALGKTFYKTTTKRPVPVSLQAPASRSEGKRIARANGETAAGPASAELIAREVAKALGAALVNLSPSTHTAVKVGYAGWEAEKVAENVEAVVTGLVERFVPKKWKGVKALHMKGGETAALPVWLADELWSGEGDVVEKIASDEKRANVGKKRKAVDDVKMAEEGTKEKKSKKQKTLKPGAKESNDDQLDKQIALRKEILKKQKEEAAKDIEDDVPAPVKTKTTRKAKSKSKKGKAVEA